MEKKELRKNYKEIRKSLSMEKISKDIMQNLFSFEKFVNAEKIFAYIPTSVEVNTSAILNIKDKEIFVPKISGNEIIMAKYTPDSLTENEYGILEPSETSEEKPNEKDIIIIPALSADEKGYRLGYGGGYYDRYLKNYFKTTKVVLLPQKLLCKELPQEDFDVKTDFIITEKEIIKCGIILSCTPAIKQKI